MIPLGILITLISRRPDSHARFRNVKRETRNVKRFSCSGANRQLRFPT